MLKLIQSAGQWLFLRVEGGFNVIFGDRNNPLHYLGALSYWLFWIVPAAPGVSGAPTAVRASL